MYLRRTEHAIANELQPSLSQDINRLYSNLFVLGWPATRIPEISVLHHLRLETCRIGERVFKVMSHILLDL